MKSVLAVYDISDKLKIANPSAKLRSYGVRLNLSAWIFPAGLVPADYLNELREKGADVHLLEFAEDDWKKVVALATKELQRHARQVIDLVKSRSESAADMLRRMSTIINLADEPGGPSEEELADAYVKREKHYRKWRSVIAKGKRELAASEMCIVGFAITREAVDGLDALKNLVAAELSAALAWRDERSKQDARLAAPQATVQVAVAV